MSSQASYMEDANLNTEHGSDRQDRKSHHQLKYKSSFLCSNPFPGQNSSINVYESSAGKTAVSDCKRSRMSFKPAVERMGSDSFSNQPGPYGSKIANEQEKPWLHDDDNHTYKAPKNENLSKTSDLIHGCSESLGTERGPSARMGKVSLLAYISVPMLYHSAVSMVNALAWIHLFHFICAVGETWWRVEAKKGVSCQRKYWSDEWIESEFKLLLAFGQICISCAHVLLLTPLLHILKVAKRVKVEFPQQNFVANASHSRSLLLTNPTKGSVYYVFSPPSLYLLICMCTCQWASACVFIVILHLCSLSHLFMSTHKCMLGGEMKDLITFTGGAFHSCRILGMLGFPG